MATQIAQWRLLLACVICYAIGGATAAAGRQLIGEQPSEQPQVQQHDGGQPKIVLLSEPVEELCKASAAGWQDDPLRCNPEKFTVLVTTVGKRLNSLQRLINRYTESGLVDAIFVVWGGQSEPSQELRQPGQVPVTILGYANDNLNSRFLPPPGLTNCAVLVTDDDIHPRTTDIPAAFLAWKRGNQAQLVGYYARSHVCEGSRPGAEYTTKAGLQCSYKLDWPDQGPGTGYSMVLTKWMLLHSKYLHGYSCMLPPAIRDYVGETFNCEDIAMNFLVAATAKAPAGMAYIPHIYPEDAGADPNALSRRPNALEKRGDCIARFLDAYEGEMPLQYTTLAVVDAAHTLAVKNKVVSEKLGRTIWL